MAAQQGGAGELGIDGLPQRTLHAQREVVTHESLGVAEDAASDAEEAHADAGCQQVQHRGCSAARLSSQPDSAINPTDEPVAQTARMMLVTSRRVPCGMPRMSWRTRALV